MCFQSNCQRSVNMSSTSLHCGEQVVVVQFALEGSMIFWRQRDKREAKSVT